MNKRLNMSRIKSPAYGFDWWRIFLPVLRWRRPFTRVKIGSNGLRSTMTPPMERPSWDRTCKRRWPQNCRISLRSSENCRVTTLPVCSLFFAVSNPQTHVWKGIRGRIERNSDKSAFEELPSGANPAFDIVPFFRAPYRTCRGLTVIRATRTSNWRQW